MDVNNNCDIVENFRLQVHGRKLSNLVGYENCSNNSLSVTKEQTKNVNILPDLVTLRELRLLEDGNFPSGIGPKRNHGLNNSWPNYLTA